MTVSQNGFKMVPEAFWFHARRSNRRMFIFFHLLPGVFWVTAPYSTQTAQQRQPKRTPDN